MKSPWLIRIACIVLLSGPAPYATFGASEAAPARITIVYDAFGAPSALERGWGFSALVEYGGKRVLFDTGGRTAAFAHNVAALGIDLTALDAVVISHRHNDHTAGLAHVLAVNPAVPIYVPSDPGFFTTGLPPAFLTPDPSLPARLRYFDGESAPDSAVDRPWSGNFKIIAAPTEILPGFHVFSVQSGKPGTMEMNELALAVATPRGLFVVVGCAHPGVENMLREAAKMDPHLYSVVGGFHLVLTPVQEIQRVATILHDELRLERVAPAHCTSETGFAILRDRFGAGFDEAGLGAVIPLP